MDTERLYNESFSSFLKHTNEKEILKKEILRDIEIAGVASVLDIGAGPGELGRAIASRVKKYLAIESNPLYIEKLKGAGLEVVAAKFPDVSIEESFDFVLASHVISYRNTLLQPFLEKAASLINPHGLLLLITHRGGEADDWAALVNIFGESVVKDYMNKFQDIVNILKRYGEVEVRIVITTVETKKIEDLLTALSFVYSNSKAELLQKWQANIPILQKWLETNYKTSEGYSFPFRHHFVSLKRA